MNRQRKVLITTTYNELGIIIDTKAKEVAQPDLQPTCNQLATDCISRQQAIDAINALHEKPNAWLDSAVDAVMTLPSAQPTQSNADSTQTNALDCVSRQAAIDAHCELCPDQHICCPIHNGNICPDIEVFRLLPSAQPELKMGKWIILPPIFEEICQCSNCKMKFKDALQWTNYCPNCDADMRGD